MVKLCDDCVKNIRNTGERYCVCSYRHKIKKRNVCSKFVSKNEKTIKKYDALAWTGVQ